MRWVWGDGRQINDLANWWSLRQEPGGQSGQCRDVVHRKRKLLADGRNGSDAALDDQLKTPREQLRPLRRQRVIQRLALTPAPAAEHDGESLVVSVVEDAQVFGPMEHHRQRAPPALLETEVVFDRVTSDEVLDKGVSWQQ